MPWADDTRCLHCNGKLPLYRKLAQGQFCSEAHRKEYWAEQEKLAVERLHQTHNSIKAYKPVDIEAILGPRVDVEAETDALPIGTASAPERHPNSHAGSSSAASIFDPPPSPTPPPYVEAGPDLLALMRAFEESEKREAQPAPVAKRARAEEPEMAGVLAPDVLAGVLAAMDAPRFYDAAMRVQAADPGGIQPQAFPLQFHTPRLQAVAAERAASEPRPIEAGLAGVFQNRADLGAANYGTPEWYFAEQAPLEFASQTVLPDCAATVEQPFDFASSFAFPPSFASAGEAGGLQDWMPGLWALMVAAQDRPARNELASAPPIAADPVEYEMAVPMVSPEQVVSVERREMPRAERLVPLAAIRAADVESNSAMLALLMGIEPEMDSPLELQAPVLTVGIDGTEQGSVSDEPDAGAALSGLDRLPLCEHQWPVAMPAACGPAGIAAVRWNADHWYRLASTEVVVDIVWNPRIECPRRDVPDVLTTCLALRAPLPRELASSAPVVHVAESLAPIAFRIAVLAMGEPEALPQLPPLVADTSVPDLPLLALPALVPVQAEQVRPLPAAGANEPVSFRFAVLATAEPEAYPRYAAFQHRSKPHFWLHGLPLVVRDTMVRVSAATPEALLPSSPREVAWPDPPVHIARTPAPQTPRLQTLEGLPWLGLKAPDLNARKGASQSFVLAPDLMVYPILWTEPDRLRFTSRLAREAEQLPSNEALSEQSRGVLPVMAGFWQNAPRDLKALLFLIPILIGLVFYPSLPKVAVKMPDPAVATTELETGSFGERLVAFRDVLRSRAAVALREDFRQGLDNWGSSTGNVAQWSFDQTGFVKPGPLALYNPTTSLSDYEMQFLGTIDQSALSWVVRARDFKNFYVLKLTTVRGGPLPIVVLTRYAVVDGVAQDRVDTRVPLNLRQDTYYKVAMQVKGDDFVLQIQDQAVDAWTEPRLPVGGVGFFSARGEQSRLRWVQVTHQYDMLGRLCAYLAPGNSTTVTGGS